MARIYKEWMVQEILKDLDGKSAAILAGFESIKACDMDNLRQNIRRMGANMRVVKNTLARIAFQQKGFDVEALEEHLRGTTALITSGDEVVEVLKLLKDFSKEHTGFFIKVGYVEERVLTREELEHLATLPPRPQLLAQLVGAMQSPIYGLAGALQGLLRGLVSCLDQIAKQKEKE